MKLIAVLIVATLSAISFQAPAVKQTPTPAQAKVPERVPIPSKELGELRDSYTAAREADAHYQWAAAFFKDKSGCVEQLLAYAKSDVDAKTNKFDAIWQRVQRIVKTSEGKPLPEGCRADLDAGVIVLPNGQP